MKQRRFRIPVEITAMIVAALLLMLFAHYCMMEMP